jgi:hypothetical protein
VKRLRFSLRTFLVLVTIIVAVFGSLMVRSRRQAESVDLLHQYQALVLHDYHYDDRGEPVRGKAKMPWPNWLVRTFGHDFFFDVENVSVRDTSFSDQEMPYVLRLRDLRFLYLTRSRITDEGLADIGNLDRLEGLNLVGTSIGDSSVEELKKLKRLEWLNIGATNISDAAARELQTALPDCDVIY